MPALQQFLFSAIDIPNLSGASVQVECLPSFRAVGEYLTADVLSCDGPFSVDTARYFEEIHYSNGDASINKTAFRINYDDMDATLFFGDLKAGRVYWQMGNRECDFSCALFDAWRTSRV